MCRIKFTESGEIVLKISLVSSDLQLTQSDLNGEGNSCENGTLLVELTDTGIG